MKNDALGRRQRFAPPNPLARPNHAPDIIVIQPADEALFQKIHRHGPLSSHYLHLFTAGLRKNENHLQKRLTELYNGDKGGPYLTRPWQQSSGFMARYQHLVYDVADRAKQYIPPIRKRTDPFLHQLMQACVGATFELLSGARGLIYIPRDTVITRKKEAQCFKAADPMAVPVGRHTLVPDDLFGIEYPGEGFRFFAVEVDRNTESIERKNLDQSSFGRKVAHYEEVLARGTYRSWWGVPNLHILTITTNAAHARNLLEYVRKNVQTRYQDRFAFAVATEFGINWRVPKDLLTQLFEPWQTPAGAKDLSRP